MENNRRVAENISINNAEAAEIIEALQSYLSSHMESIREQGERMSAVAPFCRLDYLK